MNILVLNYEYPPIGGGGATVSRDLSQRMVKAGNVVRLVTMGYDNLPTIEDDDGVEVHRVRCVRRKKASCMPDEQLTYIISALHYIDKTRLYKDVDVCHVHFIIPTAVIALGLKRKYGIPYVITAHGSDVQGYNSKMIYRCMHVLLKPFWNVLTQNADTVISPSLFLLDLMKSECTNGINYCLIPNGIDLNRYVQYSSVNSKSHRILLMGRMQYSKNMQTVIRAVAELGCELLDWEVDVLGDGPYCDDLKVLCKELNVSNKVNFVGWVENGSEEYCKHLSNASIYISASEFENCPMSVLEAVAAGCYPLLSNIPAHHQMIGEHNCFFECHDYKMLADMIKAIIHNRDGINKVNIDIERYDWENVLDKYISVLKR